MHSPANATSRRAPRGIVTLADSYFFPGLEMLYLSVQESLPMPVACFDIGLTDEQKNAAALKYPDLWILPLPETRDVTAIREAFDTPDQKIRPARPGKREWPLWLCPFLIAESPFTSVYWLDCDLVVLRNLEGLFGLLDDGPVFTPENLAPEATPNKPALYDLLPLERKFDPAVPTINGGVSGWHLERDREALEAYMHPIRRACVDLAVRDAISWHDQGSLIWGIQKCGLEHRVVETWMWNLCVEHTRASGKSYPWGAGTLAILRDEVPEANLLHWNGRPFPWPR